ncbi:unnamed protein product [Boreogadus saida]
MQQTKVQNKFDIMVKLVLHETGAQVKRDDREEEEPDADTRGADQLPQDQIQTGEEIETSQADQQRDDAEIGGPAAGPLRAVSDSSGTGTDPEEG